VLLLGLEFKSRDLTKTQNPIIYFQLNYLLNMAQPTKTKYYDDVVVVCTNGGYEYVLGMTLPELTIDVCGQSHPFYTGKEGTLIDTAGRIDRFQARLNRMNQQTSGKKDKTKKSRKFKQSLADLNESTDQPKKSTTKAKKPKAEPEVALEPAPEKAITA
jgi:large subunit ribosomal protein L31